MQNFLREIATLYCLLLMSSLLFFLYSVVNSFERISANVFKINGFSTLTKALHSLSFHSDKVDYQ